MAFLDRSQTVRTNDRAPAARGKELFVGILIMALIATLGIRNVVPADALAPTIVTVLFAVAAGFGLLCRRDRFRIMWFDFAGGLTVYRLRYLRSNRAGSSDGQASHPLAST